MRVYIFAEDPTEQHILSYVLNHAGLNVLTGTDMATVLEDWPQSSSELILLASDQAGAPMQEIVAVRAATQVPLLVITNACTESEECAMLVAGADLVLVRPVSARLLSVYVRVLLRRVETVPSSLLVSLDLGQVVLDPTSRSVTVQGQEPRPLTHLEFRLLYVLMTHREQVMPADLLVERVWGYDGGGDRELVRGLVSRLRRKVEINPEEPLFIETVQGVGYRFTVPESGQLTQDS